MLSVNQLSFGYGKKQVLQDISFNLQAGELTAVLGMNGAGKSTLLKIISGLLKPSAGELLLEDKSLHKFSKKQLACKIGYLPQNVLSMDCTVFEAVLIGRKPYFSSHPAKEDLLETARILQLTGLADFADRQMLHLSGGELQRVAIARTLAQKPSLLLMDEPINHLDIRSQLDIMALVRQLAARFNITVLIVMHDLNIALRFCDNFILMDEGRLYASGGREVITTDAIADIYRLQAVLHNQNGLPLVIPCPVNEPSVL